MDTQSPWMFSDGGRGFSSCLFVSPNPIEEEADDQVQVSEFFVRPKKKSSQDFTLSTLLENKDKADEEEVSSQRDSISIEGDLLKIIEASSSEGDSEMESD